MFKLVRKAFIKDYKNVNDKVVREKHGVVASIGGIIINLVLFAIKIVIGIIAMSRSIISDAFNNLTDLVSNVVSLIGFKITTKPADAKHPYGYERIEYVTGMIVSLIIVIVGVVLGYNSIMGLINKEATATFTLITFIILGVSIVGKVIQGFFYHAMGKAIGSVSLMANRQDSFNDAISTTVVLISALVMFYVPSLWWLDAATSLAVAMFILVSGVLHLRETTSPLLGNPPDKELVSKVLKTVKSYEGVLGIHDVVFHLYGETRVFATIHVEVDGVKPAMESHDMIDNIEEDVFKKHGVELTIHMDPIDIYSEDVKQLRIDIKKSLDAFNEGLSFHDLRVVKGPTHTVLIFDIQVPMGKIVDKNKILKQIKKDLDADKNHYKFTVKIDSSYVH